MGYNAREGGDALGAFNAVNPIHGIATSIEKTADAIQRDDYRAAGEAWGTAAILMGTTVMTVVGVAEAFGGPPPVGAGAAGAGAAEGGAAAEAAETGVTGATPSLPAYAGGKTSGVLRTAAGDTPLVSGYKGPSASMPRGTPGMNWRIKSHVEAHAAAVMRQQGLKNSTLYINQAPCAGATGCGAMLSRMLPEGARLRVVGPNGYEKIVVGLPD